MYVVLILMVFFGMTIPTKKGKSMGWMEGVSSHRGRFTKDQSIAENSKSAFKASINETLDIELDVRITKDNQLIVFHDRTLTRMCGVELDVETETLETLQQYPLGNSKDTIPTLKDTLSMIDGQVNLIIEIKPTKKINEICQLIVNQLDDYPGKFAICSFEPRILRWFKDNRTNYIRGQIIQSYLNDKNHHILNRVLLTINGYNFYTRSDFVSVHYGLISYYQWMRMFSGFVCVWSISTKKILEKVNNKADHLIFEYIHVKK